MRAALAIALYIASVIEAEGIDLGKEKPAKLASRAGKEEGEKRPIRREDRDCIQALLERTDGTPFTSSRQSSSDAEPNDLHNYERRDDETSDAERDPAPHGH